MNLDANYVLDFNKETKQESSKILFTGLDCAGKSSIILALHREISQIAILKPTKQAQRKIFDYLGRQIAEWDLGGQDRYRISYLKSPDKYFDNTSVCIYVFDIQNESRLNEALSYFSDVIAQFKKLEINPLIYIFFHKIDPDLVKNRQDQIDKIIKDIQNKIQKIVENQFFIRFVKTSIHDLWSIIQAFSDILLTLYPQHELIESTIKEFAQKMEAHGVIIFDSNSLIVAQNFENEKYKDILSQTSPYLLTLNDSFRNSKNHRMLIEREGYVYYFNEYILEKTDTIVYILIMKSKNEFPEDEVASFFKLLTPLL